MEERMLNGTLISELPEEQRPYEKCEAHGAQYLTDAELLAVIIKSGTTRKSSVALAEELLSPDGIRIGFNALINSSMDDLKQIKGIGKVKAIQLVCLGEICRRMSEERIMDHIEIRHPSEIAAYYQQRMRLLSEEEVHLMLLDSQGRFMKSRMVSRGTVNCSAISPREIFMTALKDKAAAIVLIHNHPSGDPQPSDADIRFSCLVYGLSRMMNIPLRDSLVIGSNEYFSMFEHELLRMPAEMLTDD